MKKPFFSIITVVYNGVSTIENTFKSVFKQNCNDYEYIVVDGGSSDGTVAIIQQYESQLASWISEPDEGVYDAMNKAVQLARGKWVYFLGADDTLYNVLSEIQDYLVKTETIYYGDVYRPFIQRRYDGEFSAFKLSCRNICHQSIFYPRHIFKTMSYNLDYSILSDYEFNMRCYADPDLEFSYIPVTVALFNDKSGLSHLEEDLHFQRDRKLLVNKHFPFYIYLIWSFRFYLIRVLVYLRLEKISLTIHHYLLRVLRTLTRSSK